MSKDSNDSINVSKLSKSISREDYILLGSLIEDERQVEEKKRIENQTLSTEEVVSSYTLNQYVQQDIEVMPGLKCTFRTPPPFAYEEAMAYARRQDDYSATGSRVFTRRRLAYSIVAVNDRPLSLSDPMGSSNWLVSATDPDFKEKIIESVEEVYKKLEFFGLLDKVSEVYAIWEGVIYDRINGIPSLSDVVKNSTRTSTKEQ